MSSYIETLGWVALAISNAIAFLALRNLKQKEQRRESQQSVQKWLA